MTKTRRERCIAVVDRNCFRVSVELRLSPAPVPEPAARAGVAVSAAVAEAAVQLGELVIAVGTKAKDGDDFLRGLGRIGVDMLAGVARSEGN